MYIYIYIYIYIYNKHDITSDYKDKERGMSSEIQ